MKLFWGSVQLQKHHTFSASPGIFDKERDCNLLTDVLFSVHLRETKKPEQELQGIFSLTYFVYSTE